MTNPKVTVLMSVYNGEKYLREAINSILNQTFKDFEFLIINDGSIDRTAEILQSYQGPRTEIINNEKNIGLTGSLNKGLKLAKGEYIARQDGDDVSMPERLQEQVDMLEQNSNLGVVGTWYWLIDEKNNIKHEVKNDGNPVILRWRLLFNNIFAHSSVMMRKEAYEDSGGYNSEFEVSQDYELWSRIAEKWQIGLVPRILCLWRKGTEHSITIEKNKSQKTMARRIGVGNIEELTNGRLSRKQCVDLYNLFNDYYTVDKVSHLREIFHSLKTVRECFEDILADNPIRYQINERVVAVLYRCICRASTFYSRVLICAYALWFGGWKLVPRVFLVFGGLSLPNRTMRDKWRSFVKLLRLVRWKM